MSSQSPSSVLYSSDGVELAVVSGSPIPAGTRTLLISGRDGYTGDARYVPTSTQGVLGVTQMSNSFAVLSNITINASGSQLITNSLYGTQEVALVVNAGTVTGAGNITFTIQEVDPGDGVTVYGNSASTAAISSGNAPGVFTATLNITTSTAVKVTWTVSGTFSSAIYATVVSKNTPATQTINGSISATNPSVGTDGAAVLGFDTQVGGSVTTAAPTYSNGNLNALSLTTLGGLRIDGVYAAGTANGTAADLMANGGYVTTAAPTYTTGQLEALSLDTSGNLRTSVNNTVTVTGTVTANQGTSPWVVSGTVTSNADGYATSAAPTYTNNTFNPLSLDLSGNLRVLANQGTSPWVTSVSGTVAVTQSTSPWIVAGGGTAGTPASGVVTVQGISGMTPLSVVADKAATSAVTSVASSASNVTLLSSNANRIFASVYNDSGQQVYIKLGTTASNTSYTILLMPNSYWEVPSDYTGQIDAIWKSANGNARITELTP